MVILATNATGKGRELDDCHSIFDVIAPLRWFTSSGMWWVHTYSVTASYVCQKSIIEECGGGLVKASRFGIHVGECNSCGRVDYLSADLKVDFLTRRSLPMNFVLGLLLKCLLFWCQVQYRVSSKCIHDSLLLRRFCSDDRDGCDGQRYNLYRVTGRRVLWQM